MVVPIIYSQVPPQMGIEVRFADPLNPQSFADLSDTKHVLILVKHSEPAFNSLPNC